MTDRELFLTSEAHNAFLKQSIDKKPAKVFISTFGIYLGILYYGRDVTSWGPNYSMHARDLAESMRQLPDVNILVGLQNYRSCKNKIPCRHCEMQYSKNLIRLVNHAEVFHEFNWKMTTSLHLKCAMFFYTKPQKAAAYGVTGGRNFTDSDWEDATFTMSPGEIGEMWKHIKPTWEEAWDITSDNIEYILKDQEISKRGFEAVVAGLDNIPEGDEEDLPF